MLLGLVANLLTGTIPESLDSLTNLSGLFLSLNLLTGTIPSSIGGIQGLQLFTLTNALTGTIPTEFDRLNNLVIFACSFNDLSGFLPFKSASALEFIGASNNKLSGTADSAAKMQNLCNAAFDDNQFTGTIPQAFCRRELQALTMGFNNHTGTIPSCFAALTQLTSLHLHANSLTGSIAVLPSSLMHVLLGDNDFTGGIEQFGSWKLC